MAAYTREQLEHSKPLDLNLTVAIDEGSINKVVNEVYSQLSLEPHNKNKALNNLKPPSLIFIPTFTAPPIKKSSKAALALAPKE